jgi:hypothetical protein
MGRQRSNAITRALLPGQQDDARARIQVGVLVSRAARIAAGEIEGDPAALGVQLRATEMLLRKALPDLSSIEMNANVDGALTITIVKQT